MRADAFSREYVNWWLFYLLLITFVASSTIAAGRYRASRADDLALRRKHPADRAHQYADGRAAPELERGEQMRRRIRSAAFLAASALLAIVLSFVSTKIALRGLALNFAQPMIEKWLRRKEAGRAQFEP